MSSAVSAVREFFVKHAQTVDVQIGKMKDKILKWEKEGSTWNWLLSSLPFSGIVMQYVKERAANTELSTSPAATRQVQLIDQKNQSKLLGTIACIITAFIGTLLPSIVAVFIVTGSIVGIAYNAVAFYHNEVLKIQIEKNVTVQSPPYTGVIWDTEVQ